MPPVAAFESCNGLAGFFLFEREQRQAVLEIILEMRLRGIDFSAVIPETRE